MEPADALAQLETIRILMERTALYRRALGPITLAVGAVGVVAAAVGIGAGLDSPAAFTAVWLAAAVAAVAVAFLVARRQAIGDGERFWSPPTRRVAAALLPPLAAGAALGLPFLLGREWTLRLAWLLPVLWMVLYGCALQAAGFFMRRGIRLLGAAYVVAGLVDLAWRAAADHPSAGPAQNHLLMGVVFGAGHLAYGAYLQATERRAQP